MSKRDEAVLLALAAFAALLALGLPISAACLQDIVKALGGR